MQTDFNVTPDLAQAGQTYGRSRCAPHTLAYQPQITTIVIADGSPSAGESWVLRLTDDETGLAYDVPFLSGGTLAATLDNMVAALGENGNAYDLFSYAQDGATTLTATARHPGRAYTWTVPTVGGSASATVTNTQTSGGQKLAFGLMVARDSTSGVIPTFRALAATDAAIDIAGLLFRTDGNHFRSMTDEPDPTDYSGAMRGRTFSILEEGRAWVVVESAVTDISAGVHVRRALTGAAGTVGAFRTAAAGGQQLYTLTPSAINLPGYGFEFDYQGVHYTALYLGDGSTTVAQAIDGLVQDLGSISGLTITDNATTLTIQTAAGTEITNMRNLASHTDVPVDSVAIVETDAEDVDTIDVSAWCRWERTSVTLRDGTIIAPLRISTPS